MENLKFTEKEWKAADSPIQILFDDIVQVQLPLPYALNHVNVYLLQGKNGWTIVDTGLNISSARAIWEDVFARFQIKPGTLEQIVITHLHPDHFGMAGWLQSRFSTADRTVPVYVSAQEHNNFSKFWGNLERFAPPMAELLVACGLPALFAQAVMEGTLKTGHQTRPLPHLSMIPQDDAGHVILGDRSFEMIYAPGHADGQVIFYDKGEKLFLSGDQILMKITPNIGFWHDTKQGVLQRYLDSLKELERYEVSIGLPGHKWLIAGWQERIAEMFAHHDDRLEHTYGALSPQGETVNAVSQAVFRLKELNIHQSRFAVTETLAHLDLLESRGKIQREVRDGVWYYT
ncbi:MAG: MBL fold metallo-hydrolase, partial [Chloroflexota bacterium]